VVPAQPEAAPVEPPSGLAPVTPAGWSAPFVPGPAPVGIDAIVSAPAAPADVQATQWGLGATTGTEPVATRRSADVVRSSTVWAWLIAISPILAAGSISYVLLTTQAALSSWQFEAAVAAPYLLVLLFAIADRAALLQLGHASPRSPAWALATAPAYLIARSAETRREDGSGTVLTIVWAASFIVAIAGIVGYGLLTHHALISGLPT
jgi:hypothetical protein